jgi:hypothetical protein
VAAVSLSSGAHTITCHSSTGKVRTMNVNAVEGGIAARYKFNLADNSP